MSARSSFDLDMNMPGMVMHSGASIEPAGTPGQYRAQVKPGMAATGWRRSTMKDAR